jgi:hypothetical protein
MERGCLDSAVRGSVTEDLEEELGLLGRDPAQVVVRMADALFQERKKYQGAVSERDAARDEAGWLAPIADALNSWIREHRCGEGWQTEGWDGGDIIDKLRRWHGELNGIHRQALANVERDRDTLLARAESAERDAEEAGLREDRATNLWHAAESERDNLRVAALALLEGWDARRAKDAGKLGMGINISTERAGAYTSTYYWEQLRKALDNRAQEEE